MGDFEVMGRALDILLPRLGLLCLAAALAALLARGALAPALCRLRAFFAARRSRLALLPLLLAAIVRGSSKFSFDGGIAQGETPSVATNDTVYIGWRRDTAGGIYVPESAAVYIDYRPNGETNAEWELLAETTVGAWSWSGIVPGATNYDYNVWAWYIPPEPIHTNGVWVYRTMRDRRGVHPIPLRARIEADGGAIATPAEKRKDEEHED